MAVTSFKPLVIYLHKRGFARLATEKYNINRRSDVFAHLTNYSVNKKNIKRGRGRGGGGGGDGTSTAVTETDDDNDTGHVSKSKHEASAYQGKTQLQEDGEVKGEEDGRDVIEEGDDDGDEVGEEEGDKIKLSLEELKARLEALAVDTGGFHTHADYCVMFDLPDS